MSRKLLVIDFAALGWAQAAQVGAACNISFEKLTPAFPAVTCTAQATFRTAQSAGRHGMVGNGLFFRDLAKPMFWEQSAALVEGERIWHAHRAAGGTVGLMFWQQSLGEEADLILSPKPVHKHGGGMVQDCYSRPHDLYGDLCRHIGRPFNLMHYWGPLASRKSSDWIVDSIEAVLASPSPAPDLLLGYVPHLDYDLQRHGPESRQARAAVHVVAGYMTRLRDAAARAGYDYLFFGDYAIRPVAGGAVFPNRMLREEGLFQVRRVNGRAYPDFFAGAAFAVVDHEVAHVVVPDPAKLEAARRALTALPGVAEVLDRAAQAARGLDHPRGGEFLLIADEGRWFAYPWWTDRREAPDYAGHVDIHNKPGYDPCELFFGWPPPSVSLNPGRIAGSHGRAGTGREAAWTTSCEDLGQPDSLVALAASLKKWLTASVSNR